MARSRSLPTSVSVTLPASSYASHNQRLREDLRTYFAGRLSRRRLMVRRGAFTIQIGLGGDCREWLAQIEELLADSGLNVDTGQVEA